MPSWRASQHAAPSDNSAPPAIRPSATPASVADESKISLIAKSGAARRATPAPISNTALTTKNGAAAERLIDPLLLMFSTLVYPNDACDRRDKALSSKRRSDGLEIFFFSNRSADGGAGCTSNTDLWVATRDTLSQVWYAPENLGSVVNSTSPDVQPYISSDGRSLYFSSNRPGGPGLLDIYVTTRVKCQSNADE